MVGTLRLATAAMAAVQTDGQETPQNGDWSQFRGPGGAGGRGDVTASHRLWTGRKGSNVSSPVLHEGYLYWAHEFGIAYCAEAATGNLVYEQRLTPAPGKVYASPVLADGRLYYLSRSGQTCVVAAKPTFEQLVHNDLADASTFDASPAVSNGQLLLRSDRYLYCIGQK